MFSASARHLTISRRRTRAWRATLVALLALSWGCSERRASAGAARGAGVEATDDAGHLLHLAAPAARVISLVPSATETIIALGARDRIVGRTRYDVAPEVASVPSVGGGIDPSIEEIVALHPDLVVAWDNDKREAIRAKLGTLGIAVFSMRTQDTSDVFHGIANLGHLLGRDSTARAVTASIHATLDSVRRSVAGRDTPSVFFVVYHDPPMTTGPHTFIDELIGLAGGRSIFSDATQLWPTVSMEEIVHRNPDVVIVPRGEVADSAIALFRSRPGWRDLGAIRAGRVSTVSADLVNRPGPNIGDAARALAIAIHPELGRAP